MGWPSGSLRLAGDFEVRIIPRGLENYTPTACLRTRSSFMQEGVQTGMSLPPGTVWDGHFPSFLSEREISCVLRRAHRSALLEAFPAKHRPPLCGTEGDCGFLPALRAIGFCFRAHRGGVTAATAALRPFGLATFATLGFVLKALVREKHLFAGGKNKFTTAPPHFHHLVSAFPYPPPPSSFPGRWLGILCT